MEREFSDWEQKQSEKQRSIRRRNERRIASIYDEQFDMVL